MFYITKATKKIFNLKKRIKVIQGGTSAGKTIGTLQVLIDKCQTEDKEGDITSVTSESFPHLKRGAIRDFLGIMETSQYFDASKWNKTDYTYKFHNGSILEFFSADQPSKVRGPRRKRLFINEANNVPYETFDQLEVRTEKEIFIDYNPTNEFWVHTEVLGRDDVDFIILTYKDNEALSKEIVDSIEQRKNRSGWWKVYGLGQLGEVEGKIYPNWRIIDEIPYEARLERYGIDFGYSNDPTVVVAIYYLNGGYIFDEILCLKGLSNRQIAERLLNEKKALIIADSAEPKSIDEIAGYGLNIIGAAKGKDSVRQGIQMVQDQNISVTKRSVNVIKSNRNYLWKVDKDGKILNEPDHLFSDPMDAIRYGMSSLIPVIQRNELVDNMPRMQRMPRKNPAR